MMTISEVENRPPTTAELLARLLPIPHAHGNAGWEPRASWLAGPLKMKRGNASMTTKEQVDTRVQALKETFIPK